MPLHALSDDMLHQVFDQCVDVQTGKPTALGTNRFGWKSQYSEVRRAVTQFTDQAFNDLISSAEDLYDLATTNPADVADAAKACARAGARGCASVVVESSGEALKEAVEPCIGAAASAGRCAARMATSAYGFKLGSTVSSWFNGLLAPSAARAAGETSDVLLNSSRQLQRKWKHAADFGVEGNYNPSNAARYSEALNQHINSPLTTAIEGTYRGNRSRTILTRPRG